MMWGTFSDCSNLISSPQIPNTIKVMEQTFYNCKSLVEVPEIPSSVEYMESIFYNCESLSGTIKINCKKLNDSGEQALRGAGTKGTGLKVIVPNDEVRQLLIEKSSYTASKVQIVATE